MKRTILTAAAILSTCLAAAAGPASDVVRTFYTEQLGFESDPMTRAFFTDPAKNQLDLNDKVAETGDQGCIGFGLATDAQDFDAEEIASSLELEEQVQGETAIVTARFSNFGAEQVIEWTLREVGGEWLVSDIAGPANDWRLSDFDCGS